MVAYKKSRTLWCCSFQIRAIIYIFNIFFTLSDIYDRDSSIISPVEAWSSFVSNKLCWSLYLCLYELLHNMCHYKINKRIVNVIFSSLILIEKHKNHLVNRISNYELGMFWKLKRNTLICSRTYSYICNHRNYDSYNSCSNNKFQKFGGKTMDQNLPEYLKVWLD